VDFTAPPPFEPEPFEPEWGARVGAGGVPVLGTTAQPARGGCTDRLGSTHTYCRDKGEEVGLRSRHVSPSLSLTHTHKCKRTSHCSMRSTNRSTIASPVTVQHNDNSSQKTIRAAIAAPATVVGRAHTEYGATYQSRPDSRISNEPSRH
jgi:hypothetical protein